MNYKVLKNEYTTFSDSYDKWGECMGLLFDLCAFCTCYGFEIPFELDYNPGLGLDDSFEESMYYDIFKEFSQAEITKTLLVFNRYSNKLKNLELDY